MAKYMLAEGQRRMPIDGVRVTPREGLPPLRQAETVVFSPRKLVESDLDFGSWVTEGVLVRIAEPGDPLRPVPTPPQAPPRPFVAPFPMQVVADREVAAPAVESRLSTRPKPAARSDEAEVSQDLLDAGVVSVAASAAPVTEEAPEEALAAAVAALATEEEPVAEVAATAMEERADATTQVKAGRNRNRRSR